MEDAGETPSGIEPVQVRDADGLAREAAAAAEAVRQVRSRAVNAPMSRWGGGGGRSQSIRVEFDVALVFEPGDEHKTKYDEVVSGRGRR